MKLNKRKKSAYPSSLPSTRVRNTHKTPAEVGAKFDKNIKKKKYKFLEDWVELILEEPGTVKDSSITEKIKETKDKLSFNKWEDTNLDWRDKLPQDNWL